MLKKYKSKEAYREYSSDFGLQSFLDLGRVQLIVNTKGVIHDAKDKDTDWESNATAKVKKLEKAWTVEIVIPLKSLGVEGSPKGQTWAVNFCRNRMTTGETENQAWADTGGSFHNPDAFKKLTLK